MKTFYISAVSLVMAVLMISSCGSNQNPKVKVNLPQKDLVDSASYLLGVDLGNMIKYSFGEENNLDFATIKKGINDALKAKWNRNDSIYAKQFKYDPKLVNKVLSAYADSMMAYRRAVNEVAGEEFLEAKLKEAGVKQTEEGLVYEILNEGNEVKAVAGDTVRVNYTGSLINGTEFDSNKFHGDEPAEFVIGPGMIQGFNLGLGLVGEGGHVKIYMPAKLGYGEWPHNPIGPCETIIFDIEVIKVSKYGPDPTPAE